MRALLHRFWKKFGTVIIYSIYAVTTLAFMLHTTSEIAAGTPAHISVRVVLLMWMCYGIGYTIATILGKK